MGELRSTSFGTRMHINNKSLLTNFWPNRRRLSPLIISTVILFFISHFIAGARKRPNSEASFLLAFARQTSTKSSMSLTFIFKVKQSEFQSYYIFSSEIPTSSSMSYRNSNIGSSVRSVCNSAVGKVCRQIVWPSCYINNRCTADVGILRSSSASSFANKLSLYYFNRYVYGIESKFSHYCNILNSPVRHEQFTDLTNAIVNACIFERFRVIAHFSLDIIVRFLYVLLMISQHFCILRTELNGIVITGSMYVRPSVRTSVRSYVRPSVRQSRNVPLCTAIERQELEACRTYTYVDKIHPPANFHSNHRRRRPSFSRSEIRIEYIGTLICD